MAEPTGAPTLEDLVAEIADDLARPDLDPQIRRAVLAAVRRHQTARLAFNETIFTFTTLPGTDVYGSGDAPTIPECLAIDGVVLIENDQARPLRRVPEAVIEARDDQGSTAHPCAYAYFGRAFRLWPVPSDAWTIRVQAHVRVDVEGDDVESPWFAEGRDLIVARAKWHLAAHVLRDPALAAAMSAAEGDALRALRGAANVVAASGQIQAYDL